MACDISVNKTLFLMSIQHRLNYGRQMDVETTIVFLMACDISVNKTFLMSIQQRLNYGREMDVETTLCS